MRFLIKTPRSASLLRYLLCVLAWSASSCRPLLPREVAVPVLAAEGEGSIVRSGRAVRLTSKAFLRPSDSIILPAGSRADLMLLPGILLELKGGSEMQIEKLEIARDGDEDIQPMSARNAQVQLLRGALIASVGRAQTESHLSIVTAAGDFRLGPACTVQLISTGTRVAATTVRGEVTFQPANNEPVVKIPPGDVAELPLPPGESPRAAATSGAAEQAGVIFVLEVEKRLLALEKERGTGYPAPVKPWLKESSKAAEKSLPQTQPNL